MKKSPGYVWVIALLALFISGVGAYDYLMTLAQNEAYFAALGYGARQIAYFTDYPWLLRVFWTFGVWGTVVGAVFLAWRPRWSAYAFSAALAGQLVLDIATFGFKHRWEILGPALCTQDLLVLLLTAALTGLAWHRQSHLHQ